MMNFLKKNKRQAITLVLVVIGLVLTVYLVQKQQIFKSRANQQIYNTFTITQTTDTGEQSQVACQDENCTIDSSDIEIKADVDELERLSQE